MRIQIWHTLVLIICLLYVKKVDDWFVGTYWCNWIDCSSYILIGSFEWNSLSSFLSSSCIQVSAHSFPRISLAYLPLWYTNMEEQDIHTLHHRGYYDYTPTGVTFTSTVLHLLAIPSRLEIHTSTFSHTSSLPQLQNTQPIHPSIKNSSSQMGKIQWFNTSE